ncbi:MAG: IclR family transcriptional regulator C-terminal domain-containing protein [Pseudomonadota bacterium]
MIDFPSTKNARLIFAIVSTTNIPNPLPNIFWEASEQNYQGGHFWTPITPQWGSILHAVSQSLQDNEQVHQLLNVTNLTAVTPWSKTDPEEILVEISKCRELGFAVVKQETSAGTITLASPVTKGSDAIAGVSVHSPIAGHYESEFIAKTLQSVVAVSRALSI